MKRLALCLSLLILASPSDAAVFSGTGTVSTIQVFDSVYGTDVDWFSLTGVASLGTCKTAGGFVVLRIRDNPKGQRMFTLVLAARTSGTSLTVSVDDTMKDPSGFCFVLDLVD